MRLSDSRTQLRKSSRQIQIRKPHSSKIRRPHIGNYMVLIEISNIYIFDNLDCFRTPANVSRRIINQGFGILN